MSHPCRTFVENATPAGNSQRAIIMPPPNEALADPSLPLYSALSLSPPLLSLLLSPLWIVHQHLTHHVTILSPCLGSELYSPVSYLGNASSYQNSSTPTRSSLGYRRQKLSSAIHPYAVLYCMSILLCVPLQTVETAIV
jgi:hypothetical protein